MHTCTIYYDPNSTLNHNPSFSSLENGSRVEIDIEKYRAEGFRIVGPRFKPEYFKMVKKIHGSNPLIKYLWSNPFTPNCVQKLFHIKPRETKLRNCHACTSPTSKSSCAVCQTQLPKDKFYKYAYSIDSKILDSDTTYVNFTSIIAIKASVSLVCQMIDDMVNNIISKSFAIIRPPGHHACHNKSGGFCLVNNIAIAAEYAVERGFNRIFIFDFDAHHGNGTQEIFYARNDVYYCSMHTIESYPKTGLPEETGSALGLGYNLNIIVEKGIDTTSYLEIFNSKVIPAIDTYNPDLILVSAGFDGLESDPMAIMKLTTDCYGLMVQTLADYKCPLGLVLEGGYDLENLPKCYNYCLEAMVHKPV